MKTPAKLEYATLALQIHSESKPRSFLGRSNQLSLLHDLGLATSPQEAFWVIAYNPLKLVGLVAEIARDRPYTVNVHRPSLFGAVLASGYDRFSVAHNHPSGEAKPTNEDFVLTALIAEGAKLLGLSFEDHLIVTPNPHKLFSFVEAKFLTVDAYDGQAAAGATR